MAKRSGPRDTISTGHTIVEVGGIEYLVGGEIIGSIISHEVIGQSDSPIPATVCKSRNVAKYANLQSEIEQMILDDDVLKPAFTSHIICYVERIICQGERIDQHGNPITVYQTQTPLVPGPYFLKGNDVHQASRLYLDDHLAFSAGLQLEEGHDEPEKFKTFNKVSANPDGSLNILHYIAVPSRHYSPSPTPQWPLCGIRIAVKDIYNIRGLTMSAGCSSFGKVQGVSQSTSPSIQALINQGAVLVAMAKTTPMAVGMAGGDWGDEAGFTCPINPRGNRHLDPDCSSAGSATCVAAYEWLDIAIGSDSLGSITGPSSACGIFGLRPSHGALSNEGAMLVSRLFDTPGPFSRSITLLSRFTKAWLATTSIYPAYPEERPMAVESLWFIDTLSSYCQDSIKAMERFIKKFATFYGGLPTVKRFHDLCGHSGEIEYAKTVPHIQMYESYQYHLKFREQYRTKFAKEPIVNRMLQLKWQLGSQVTDEEYKLACHQQEIFKTFLDERIFTGQKVLLFPGGAPSLRPRCQPTKYEDIPKWQGYGFKNNTVTVLAGFPCVSVPVGQAPYFVSEVRDGRSVSVKYYEPVSVLIVGPRGSDIWLVNLVERYLGSEGRTSVLPGADMFDPEGRGAVVANEGVDMSRWLFDDCQATS